MKLTSYPSLRAQAHRAAASRASSKVALGGKLPYPSPYDQLPVESKRISLVVPPFPTSIHEAVRWQVARPNGWEASFWGIEISMDSGRGIVEWRTKHVPYSLVWVFIAPPLNPHDEIRMKSAPFAPGQAIVPYLLSMEDATMKARFEELIGTYDLACAQTLVFALSCLGVREPDSVDVAEVLVSMGAPVPPYALQRDQALAA